MMDFKDLQNSSNEVLDAYKKKLIEHERLKSALSELRSKKDSLEEYVQQCKRESKYTT